MDEIIHLFGFFKTWFLWVLVLLCIHTRVGPKAGNPVMQPQAQSSTYPQRRRYR